MKTFKFEMGGMFVFYSGETLGKAILAFIKHRPNYVDLITAITEESTS